jgi:DNA-binding PadR family transcriptional regulator
MPQRLTRTTLAVLGVLLDAAPGEMWGYRIGQLANGVGSGTLYPILKRLEDEGLVSGRWEGELDEGGRRRRYYRLTGEGVIAAREALELKRWTSASVEPIKALQS